LFLTFDLDRVLIQNPFLLGVMPTVRRRLRPYVDPAATGGAHPDLWIAQRISSKSKARMLAGDYTGAYDWDEIINELAKELAFPDHLDIAGLVRSFCRPEYIAAYPDVVPALDLARRRAKCVWWISNGYARYQQPVMEALGLDRFFDGHFAPDRNHLVKPQPELFAAAARASGLPPEDGVHVGDRLTDDVAGAKRAGMRAVLLERHLPEPFRNTPPLELPKLDAFREYAAFVARGEGVAEVFGIDVEKECVPDAVITSLEQLPAVLDELAGGIQRGGAAGSM